MNYEGSCYTQATRVCVNWHPWWLGGNWAKKWTCFNVKPTAPLCWRGMILASLAYSTKPTLPPHPWLGDIQGCQKRTCPFPNVSPTKRKREGWEEREKKRTLMSTLEYPGITSCLQSVALPKSNPHSHVCIFNPGPSTQAFQIPVKKWKQVKNKQKKKCLLLLQCSLQRHFCSGLWVLCLSAGIFLL